MFAAKGQDFEMASNYSYNQDMVTGTEEVVIFLDVLCHKKLKSLLDLHLRVKEIVIL